MMCDLWHVYVNVNFPLQAGFGEMGIASSIINRFTYSIKSLKKKNLSTKGPVHPSTKLYTLSFFHIREQNHCKITV